MPSYSDEVDTSHDAISFVSLYEIYPASGGITGASSCGSAGVGDLV